MKLKWREKRGDKRWENVNVPKEPLLPRDLETLWAIPPLSEKRAALASGILDPYANLLDLFVLDEKANHDK